MFKHAFELWDVLLRVPLIMYVPGAEPHRVSKPRSHIDLAPTIMDLMGLPPLEGFQGQSLVPEIFGAEPPDREPILLELAEDSHNPYRRAIVAGDYKLIAYGPKGRSVRLFNLRDDPGEKKNLARKDPKRAAALLKKLWEEFEPVGSIQPHGNMKLKSGRRARGPSGPPPTPGEK